MGRNDVTKHAGDDGRPAPAGYRRPIASARPQLRLLLPLRERDFALLWTGMTVSFLGDGIYFVAVAWQAYTLSNAPTALALVGVAWTLPTVLFLLVGGAISDRLERRRVLLVANVTEAVAIGLIGILALSGALTLWMLLVLVAIYGSAEAFFNPAFEAIVPTLVPPEEYAQAAALDQFVRPLALQLIGPALGGMLVALTSPGVAFVVDAGTFAVSVCALLAMRPKATPSVTGAPRRSIRSAAADVAEGFRFVRANPWLWGTLLGACISLLAFYGPFQVLLPFLVKNKLHAGGGTFGAIRAASGIGAIVTAAALAQTGLPRRCVTFMFTAWGFESLTLAGFAVASHAWVFAAISLAGGAGAAAGNIVWGTLMKSLVPNELLGRVSSFDWFVSIGLIPLSFAITGPLAEAIGARATLLWAGGLGAVSIMAFLAVPGLRDPERTLASAGARA
jgi:MFS family permease